MADICFHGTSRWLFWENDLLGPGWLFTSIIIYIMWTYLVTKKEDVEKSRVRKFQTWSHGRPWFSLNFRHENVDNKMYCVHYVWHSK